MRDYLFISIIALYCYAFFLMAFLTSKRNRMINNFILVLVDMVFWTGGSLLMRSRMWPSYELWYHVSLAGIWLLPYFFLRFIRDYAGEEEKRMDKLALILLVTGTLFNMKTNFFLAPPEIVTAGETISFEYHMEWPVAIMYGLCALVLARIFAILWKAKKRNTQLMKQLAPLCMGMIILYLGNLGLTVLKNFPLDIVAGVCNAVLMFWMLYSGHLFKLTLLVSQGNCYILAMGLSMLLFFNQAKNLEFFIQRNMPGLVDYSSTIVAALAMVLMLILYVVMKVLFNRLFIQEEQKQTEKLSEYTMEVSKSLELREIYRALVDVITETLHVKKVYICIGEADGTYKTVFSTSPLDDSRFAMDAEHPLVEWMKEHDECLQLHDFKRTMEYKSMWEDEKNRLDNMWVECFLPLKDNEELVGIVMLSEKDGKRRKFTADDISFLNSLEAVTSIAVKNSKLYEKAYREARTDELTDLLNRKCFYETLEETYQKCVRSSMALLIFNVDDFKLYNQLYGNQEGDEALRHIAQIIKGTVGESGYVARYSGKEYAVILPEYDIYSAQALAENISSQIRTMNKQSKDGYLKMLTVSCGICGIPYAANSTRELLQNAEQAVYHVKHSGKNGIMVFSDGFISSKKLSAAPEKHKSMYSEYAPTIYALTAAIDAKDHYTFQHSKNVAYYSETLAAAMNTSEEFREILKEAALLHDIGKIGVSEQILNKQGPLTDAEFDAMKGHVEYSIGIIRHLPSMDYVIPAVIGHHERYDGRGYPRRIAGKDIPLAARILCIADSFDAMLSKRCYKPEMSLEYAVAELERGAGAQFDPELVVLFVELVKNGTVVPVLAKKESEEFELAGMDSPRSA